MADQKKQEGAWLTEYWQEALRRIEEAKENGGTEVDLSFLALPREYPKLCVWVFSPCEFGGSFVEPFWV